MHQTEIETPCGNTGSLCQGFQTSLDFLNATFRLSSEKNLTDFAEWLTAVLRDKIEYFPGTPIVRGKRYENTARSVAGFIIAWNEDSAWVSIPGDALKQSPQSEIVEIIRFLVVGLEANITRVDVALDDFEKRLKHDDIQQAIKDGNHAGFKTWEYYQSKGKLGTGWTFYCGSRQSDDRTVIYNKFVESLGKIDSVRLERRMKDAKAHEFCKNLLLLADNEIDLADYLSASAVGGISFVDRASGDRLSRCKLIDWWSVFLAALDTTPLKCTPPRRKHYIHQVELWIEKQVETSLALLADYWGNISALRNKLDLWVASGRKRFTGRHLKLLQYCRDNTSLSLT